MHRDLRVVRARLDAQVAAGAGRVDLVAGERREVDQRRRTAVGDASLSKNEGPNPMVTVSDAAGSSRASPVSAGGASGLSGRAPFSAVSCPAVMRSAACVHVASIRCTAAGLVEVRSSAEKYMWFCAGVMMPAWCTSRNGTTSLPGAACGAECPAA